MKIALNNKFILLIFLLFLYGCSTPNTPIKQQDILIDFGDKNINNISKKYKSMNQNTKFAIKFFGDSHIATDDLASAFRNTLFKENSVGFGLPALPKYHLNKLLKYKINNFEMINSQFDAFNDYPLCGVIAKSSTNQANIKLMLDEKLNNKMIFEILYKSKQKGDVIEIKDTKNTSFKIQNSGNNRWQSKKFELIFPIQITALKKDVLIGSYKIYQKNGAKFADICGLNGAHMNLYQKWNNGAFFRDLNSIRYDIIVVAYGTNDSFNNNLNENIFYKNTKQLINLIKKSQPNTTILMLSPPTALKPKFKTVQKIIKKVAKEDRLLFYDIDLFMKLTGSKRNWIKQGLSKKDVHLTQKGYIQIGKEIARELKKIMAR
ncbi:GDSL-type esterase/lipase family protein [Campylobacter pinnipediorum]|uniref:GDSL-type esterase/lipase family protein n=1 Tax=Campylobacter pinnipediorum TaxID=1965231 RepID=UPI000994EF36|nr:GDSL-type esterase/lipase family protein [Campylobacter pinnipediorum]AQW82209.1 SGNH family hydrolase [Campylobacter pinnipediorum subsp. pinnipediorum]